MNKFKSMAFAIAIAISTISAVGCSKENNNSIDINSSSSSSNETIGENKFETELNKPVTIDNTIFTVNDVINVDKTTEDGDLYVYIKYTIENNSETSYPTDLLNNFYLVVDDTNIKTDVRAELYAKQNIEGYVDVVSIDAGATITNYAGFIIPADTSELTVGYYATAESGSDKSNTAICTVSSSEFITPPEGMLK